jgi:hypothetical protein
MFFLSPALLWFAAAAAVPVLIHLINRRRHRTIQWAAMQFLLKASRQSRGKRKLRHILILTCRALAIAALATAAARPVVSGLAGWGGGPVDTVVLLLDRSASMEIKPGDGLDSRRLTALRMVRDAIADLGAARLVLLDSATAEAREVPSLEVLDTLSQAAASDTAADFPALLGRAAEFLADRPGRSEIWLASDMQESNWHPDDERWARARASLAALPQKPALRVIPVTGPTAANFAVRIHAARRTGNDLLLDVEILRSGEARGNSSIPLATRLNATTTTDNLTLSGQSLRFQKRLGLPPGSENGHGWLSIPADGNPRDNAAFFAYGPARPGKSLVVAPAGESADYLTLAAAPPGLENLESRRVDAAEAIAAITPDFAAILWAVPLPDGPPAQTLVNFLKSGGHVLFLPPGTASITSFDEMNWAAPEEAPSGSFFILGDWNRTDGPLRDGIDGTAIAGQGLKAIRRQLPTGQATPLARWEDGQPALTRRIVDRGTAWFLGTTPDYTWSNLGDADVLLPAIQRIITEGNSRFDASYLATVGSSEARAPAGETRSRIDDYGNRDPANTMFEAGIHRVGERLLALNRPESEDTPEILTRGTIDALLHGTGHTLLDPQGSTTGPDLSRDVWRAFLVAMLLLLLSEAILCLPKKTDAAAPAGTPASQTAFPNIR